MSGQSKGADVPPEFDKVSALLALITTLAIVGSLAIKYRSRLVTEPLTVGKRLPSLRLLDAITSEPLVLLGLRGKVVLVSFISVDSGEAVSDLTGLEKVWKRFKTRPKFAMATAVVEVDRQALLQSQIAALKATQPVYLASPETRHAFGADGAQLPLHVLIDELGNIATVAQGRDPETLARLADQVERRLGEVEPFGNSRFAWR